MLSQPALFEARTVDAPLLGGACPALNGKTRGAVFTKPSVVEFILDLVGYVPDKPLWQASLLEPSFGAGGFLFEAVARLLNSWRQSDAAGDDSALDDAVRAVELDLATFHDTKAELVKMLVGAGLSELSALRLSKKWLINADFLDHPFSESFGYVVGNPPYVRQELIPDALLERYRQAYTTMVGRADLYVPFFERGLSLLAPEGKLSFICADAWTKNGYGRVLRELVTDRFTLRTYVDMYGADAFENQVGAYPSITVIENAGRGQTRTGAATGTEPAYLKSLARELSASSGTDMTLKRGGAPWLLHANDKQAVIRDLEHRFGTLEQAGCRVGIGVATGADRVFIARLSELDVEESRKLPLAMSRDISRGAFNWTGMGVVNPWQDDVGLVDLGQYPKLAGYLAPHRAALSRRHTAKANPSGRWYKTIDRITPSLTWQPKLLVPDIRGDGDAISYDPGTAYPHHNLYYIVSHEWDLRALQALLRSGVAQLFINAYAVKTGGGYLRFQAQYLRRIRLPSWASLPQDTQRELSESGKTGTKVTPCVVERAYGVKPGSMAFLNERLLSQQIRHSLPQASLGESIFAGSLGRLRP
ncbi:MAG: Eco57I restriction-modification methylase domain-containing protein [Propionibacteriaceae bacterium]|jgi:hypothetical protein|nr:Eco57I restriction-modification methylase domain-containing protein [Propionibacteriaceae bacterium]